jgi:hypothetical protein
VSLFGNQALYSNHRLWPVPIKCSEKLGLGIDNAYRIGFLSVRMNKCLERVNDRIFF